MSKKLLNWIQENKVFINDTWNPAYYVNVEDLIKQIETLSAGNEHEASYLEMFNRIKLGVANIKLKTRKVSKKGQLNNALEIYSMEELGKVVMAAFKDDYHRQTRWKWVTTEYCTRDTTIEKYLNGAI